MIKELIKIANELDSRGLVKEADLLDSFVKLSTELDSPEGLGELVDLDEYRRKAKNKDPSKERLSSKEYKEYLGENWEELQRAIDDLKKNPPEDMDFHLVVFEDGATYSTEASIVSVDPFQMERIEEGEKIYNVVPPDHLVPDAKWKDIWDIIKSEDL